MNNGKKKVLAVLFLGVSLLAACEEGDPLVDNAMENGATREEAEEMAELARELFDEEELAEMTGEEVGTKEEDVVETAQIEIEEEVFVLTEEHEETMNVIEQLMAKQSYSDKGLQQAVTNVHYVTGNVLKESIEQMNYDWLELAKQRGEELLVLMPERNFSKNGLSRWLENEHFDWQLAEEAVASIDFDWKENAVLHAKESIESLNLSEDEVRYSLKQDGFSEEDIEYAINQVFFN